MATVTPPKYTKQVMVLLEPDTSGEVYAWAQAQGRSASAVCRELIAAGLKAKRAQWERDAAVPPSAERIESLQAEHRRQGEAQTERRREDDADRRKPATG